MAGISDFLKSLHVDWQIVLAKKSPQVLQVVKVDLGKAKAAFPPLTPHSAMADDGPVELGSAV